MMRNTRRATLAALSALVLGLVSWRPWRARRRFILGLDPRTIPGDRYRKFRVGPRDIYLREDLFAAGVLSGLRDNNRKSGRQQG